MAYQQCFSDMSESLVDKVRDSFFGYSSYISQENAGKCIGEAQTMNELLHVIHSYVLNTNDFWENMPTLEEKQFGNWCGAKLYGDPNNEIARSFYDAVEPEIDGAADIIALQDRTIIMVRDRGHALSIEIDDTDKTQDPLVSYHIPKICNLEMCKKLRGINLSKLDEKSTAATGLFSSKRNAIASELMDFILKVPMDKDMELVSHEDLIDSIRVSSDNGITYSIYDQMENTIPPNPVEYVETSYNPGQTKPVNPTTNPRSPFTVNDSQQNEFYVQDAKKLSETRKIGFMQKTLSRFKNFMKKLTLGGVEDDGR